MSMRQAGMSLLCIVGLLLGCDDDAVTIPPGALVEQTVDLQGQWKVSRAWINGQEASELFDFGQITLTLDMTNQPTSYRLETGQAPFPVIIDGEWTYDDLAYPTQLIFSNPNQRRAINFDAPPISANKTFKLSFTLGCADNTYVYEFEKT